MKYIIVDSVKDGNRYLRKQIQNKKNGTAIVNVKCTNLLEFAKEVVTKYMAKRTADTMGYLAALDVLDSMSGAVFVLKILEEKAGADYFIPKESLSQETAQEVWNVLSRIRMGKTTKMFEECTDKRVQQLKELREEYEALLIERELYDVPYLYKKAIEVLQKKPVYGKREKDTIVISNVCKENLSAVELEFLEMYTNGKYEEYLLEADLKEDILQGVEFFKSYGISNEVQYVVSQILEKKQALGDVDIFYASEEYEPYLEAVFHSRNMPYAMVDRQLPADNIYLHVMKEILNWAGNNYSYELLKPVIIRFGKYRRVFYKEIRAGIGWGAERYYRYIDAERKNAVCLEELEDAARKEQVAKLEFCEILECLADVFRWEEQIGTTRIPYVDIYWRLVECTRKIVGNNKAYKYVYPALCKFAKKLKHLEYGKNMDDVIDVLSRELKNLTYDDMETKDSVSIQKLDGRVHILERKHAYVLGMSSAHFSAANTESPVLSDKELESFLDTEKGYVRLAKEQEQRKVNALYRTLASRNTEGSLMIGYSDYDTVNLRYLSPSIPYIRLMQKAGADDSAIKKAKYEHLILQDIRFKEEMVWGKSEKSEKSEQPEKTEQELLDSPIASWSTTSLQELLACPLQFYYHRVLRIPDENYKEAKPDAWLPASEKGTLAHGIMEDYCNEIFLNKKSTEIGPAVQETLFEEIVNTRIASMLEVCPYTSKAAYEIEAELVKTNCRNYLESMHREFSDPANKWMVIACEKEFKDIELSFTAEEAVNLKFRGQMDRLDCYLDGNGVSHYRIMDYKSGSRKRHEIEIEDHRSVQHIVYKLALEALEKEEKEGKIEVEQVTFIHFFEDDVQNQELTLGKDKIKDFPYEVHEIVTHVIKNGAYQKRVTGDEEKDERNKACDYCTYKNICKENIGVKL